MKDAMKHVPYGSFAPMGGPVQEPRIEEAPRKEPPPDVDVDGDEKREREDKK